MDNEELMVLDLDDLVDYVYSRVLGVDRETLALIFELENDYLVENGFAFIEDGEDDGYVQ